VENETHETCWQESSILEVDHIYLAGFGNDKVVLPDIRVTEAQSLIREVDFLFISNTRKYL
jgi:hypothetical protein